VGTSDEDGGTSSDESGDATSGAATTVPATATSDTPTTSAEATGTTTATSGPADTGSMDDGCFDDGDDGIKLDLGAQYECDIFVQDCARGMKCVGDRFSNRVCVPIVDDALADGDPCDEEVGSDPCGVGSECTLDAPGDAMGVCRPQCTGTAGAPECPPATICVIDADETNAFCDRPCEPLAAAACEGFACVPTMHGFGCVPPGDGVPPDDCTTDEACARDHACAPADDVEGCCGTACCTPLCDAAHPCVEGECIAIEPPLVGGEGVGWCRTA
jgi:hypothetical protein